MNSNQSETLAKAMNDIKEELVYDLAESVKDNLNPRDKTEPYVE